MKNILEDLDIGTKIIVINRLTEINAKVDLIYNIQQLAYVPYPIVENVINYKDIWFFIENLQKKLDLYIIENDLKDSISERYVPPRDFFNPDNTNIITLVSKIYRLLEQIFPDIPQILQLDLHNYIKLAQREGEHMPKFRDSVQDFVNKMQYNFVNKLNNEFYNSSTITNDGADYLASQLNVYLPMDESGRSLLSLSEKRLTIKLAEFYKRWGGTVHETNEMLNYVFKDFGRAWVEVDESKKTNRINVVFEHPPRKFLLDYWRDAGLLPPERVGFKGLIVVVGDAPIGFNNNYRNFLEDTARFGFSKEEFSGRSQVTKFKQLKYTFAEQGEKEEIPEDYESDNSVSFEDGFTELYSKSYQTGGLIINRKHLNYLFNKLFESYKFWQRNSMFEWTENTEQPTTMKSFQVKYQGKVYQRLADVKYDGKTPDKSTAYELIDYTGAVTVEQIKKIYDLFYWQGDVYDAVAGVANYIENKTGDKYKNHLTNYNSNIRSKINFNDREYIITRPNINGYFTIINNTRVGTPDNYSSATTRLNSWSIKNHDHKVTLTPLNGMHTHELYNPGDAVPTSLTPKYGRGGLSHGDWGDRGILEKASSTLDGKHTHSITQKNKEVKELHPTFIDMEKITIYQKISDGAFNPKFEAYTSKPSKFNVYGSKSDYATEIPVNDGAINFKKGFTDAFDSGTTTKGLTLYDFNGLIKLYTLFVEQVINKGYVDHAVGNVYDYGCRVKYLQKIYISLKDNNTSVDFTNKSNWIDETYIARNRITADIFPSGTILTVLNGSLTPEMQAQFYQISKEETPAIDPNSTLGKIIGNKYKDNKLPKLQNVYIRTEQIGIEEGEASKITPEQIGSHKHDFTVEEAGDHTHDLQILSNRKDAADGEHNDILVFNGWRFDGTTKKSDLKRAGNHTHEITSEKAGDGENLILDNISVSYLVKK